MTRKIDTHGLRIKGLRKASGETDWGNPRHGNYTEIFWDQRTGEVWGVHQVSFGHNSWSEYHDPDIVKVCIADDHMTMQAIADAIWAVHGERLAYPPA